MTIAQRFIAGEKRDKSIVPSGRLNPTPKHTVHRNRFVDIEADVRISHFQTPFSFVPMGLLFSFPSPAINRRSIITYPYWDFLSNLPSS